MFQAIKIYNYQNLLATKNNRKVTFSINQFQVSICSSAFSPCISPDKTLRIVLSLSINIVFCISPATCFANSFLFKTFDNSTIALFIPQIQIFFDSLSSKIKSGLLDVFVFRRLNSKSITSLALPLFQYCTSLPPFFVQYCIFPYKLVLLCPCNCKNHQYTVVSFQILTIANTL